MGISDPTPTLCRSKIASVRDVQNRSHSWKYSQLFAFTGPPSSQNSKTGHRPHGDSVRPFPSTTPSSPSTCFIALYALPCFIFSSRPSQQRISSNCPISDSFIVTPDKPDPLIALVTSDRVGNPRYPGCIGNMALLLSLPGPRCRSSTALSSSACA